MLNFFEEYLYMSGCYKHNVIDIFLYRICYLFLGLVTYYRDFERLWHSFILEPEKRPGIKYCKFIIDANLEKEDSPYSNTACRGQIEEIKVSTKNKKRKVEKKILTRDRRQKQKIKALKECVEKSEKERNMLQSIYQNYKTNKTLWYYSLLGKTIKKMIMNFINSTIPGLLSIKQGISKLNSEAKEINEVEKIEIKTIIEITS